MTEAQGTEQLIAQLRDGFGDEFARIAAAGSASAARGPAYPARLLLVGVALVLAVVIAATFAIPALDNVGSAPEDALAITRSRESVTVRVVDASADPVAMTDQLRAAGVDAEVVAVAVDSDRVGQWVMVSGWDGSPEDLGGQLESHPQLLTIPKDSSGLVLVVGRAAQGNEAIDVLPDGATLPQPAPSNGAGSANR